MQLKVVIFAGGLGTRLSEETRRVPKPMVEIGGMPILWHIMKIYSSYGHNEFILCLGYKKEIIKEYFKQHALNNCDYTQDLENETIQIHKKRVEPWKITFIDTGLMTNTGGRLMKIKKYVGNESFMLTYGDGVGNVDINKLIQFHKENKKKATITSVIPEGRFGILKLDKHLVKSFEEKKKDNKNRINAGFFVLEPEIFNYIKEDVMWEREPLENLAKDNQLVTYCHKGFWMAMDKLSDKNKLEELWTSGCAEWKVWND